MTKFFYSTINIFLDSYSVGDNINSDLHNWCLHDYKIIIPR